jgi:DNA primase
MISVLEYYSIDYQESGDGRYKAICPFHTDHHPSLEIYTDNDSGQDSWCCYPCDLNGDCFRFIQQQTANHSEAVKVAQNIIKSSGANGVVLNKDYRQQQEKRREQKKLFTVQHGLNIQYREWLRSLKGTTKYQSAVERVDKIFEEIDNIIESGDYNKAMDYLFVKEEKLAQAIKRTK